MKKLVTAFIFFSISATTLFAHVSLIPGTHSQQTTYKLEKVNGVVYALFGSGGNIGVSYGDDGLMTIDTQFERNVVGIKEALSKLGTDKPRFVFNTHYHGDHTGGNVLFGNDALIIAQDNVRYRLLNPGPGRDGAPGVPMAKQGLPMITYDKSVALHINGEKVKALHFPSGHTDGDTVIFFTTSNVVHLGDDFFVGRFPYVDLGSGGSVNGLIDNIGKLLGMIPVDAKLIPGHGPVSTIEDLRAYHSMLVSTTLYVRKMMKEGKTLDEIKKAGLPAEFKSWAPEGSFINEERWIETIFNSYQPKVEMKKG
ncbi:MAG: MBL fold metallo-hydrolase [Pyrinomonadaceae bacterium]